MGVIETPPDLLKYYHAAAHGTILVISGWRGVGKSRYCQQAVMQFCQAGIKVSGILSPARFEDGHKTGIFSQDIASGETQLLASTIKQEIIGVRLGPYFFDADVVKWSDECIRRIESGDLVVIDELGFLEFDRQDGLVSSFEVLRKKHYQLAMVVIRPECVAAFSKMSFDFDLIEIDA